ncbi:hypothetical protein CK203_012761 [Vitis vinifera]|uniref:Uncharacterized protein n=1 Tax=Vitis vinifera TaxID=29760 RepID=A0A438KN85_VITVI|nr:hypothetical protein CK203_012761 [Vitis vinifera]
MGFCDCFGGGLSKQERLEEERIASEEARAKAAEAAQKRQEQFEQSAQGRAARAQQAAMAKQSASSNKGEPVLKIHISLALFMVGAVDAVADGMSVSAFGPFNFNCLLIRPYDMNSLFLQHQYQCMVALELPLFFPDCASIFFPSLSPHI